MKSEDKIIKAPQGFTESVLAKTTRAKRPAFSRGLAWQLAAASLLLALGFGLGQWRSHRDGFSTVAFHLDAPRAQSVSLAGDFTNWEMRPLKRQGEAWELSLEVPSGKHQYIFVLNGKRMVLDPAADAVESGAKGEAYSVLDLSKASPL